MIIGPLRTCQLNEVMVLPCLQGLWNERMKMAARADKVLCLH